MNLLARSLVGATAHVFLLVSAAAVLALGCESSASNAESGPDLAKIHRTLAKEPKYQFQPQYTLLVFGPRAESRVWVVLDKRITGDFQDVRGILYVDRNGDGDLTAPGERIGLKEGKPSSTEFEPVEIHGKNGHKTYRLHIKSLPMPYYRGFFTDPLPYRGGDPRVWVEDMTAKRMYAVRAVNPAERITAERPQDAPIAHISGPLIMDFAQDKPFLPTGKAEYELRAAVVTHGYPQGIMSVMMFNALPSDAHPTAVLEFPAKSARASTRIEAVLKRRCCGSCLYDTVRVPDDIVGKKVKVTLSLGAWKQEGVAAATLATVLPADDSREEP